MEEQAQNKQIGAIAVHSQYIKDLSLEIPHAPEIFSEIKSAPKIDVHVDVKSEPKGNNTYTSQLSISMNGKVEDKTLFVLELTYAAFAELNVPAEHLEPVLMIELPRLIFPLDGAFVLANPLPASNAPARFLYPENSRLEQGGLFLMVPQKRMRFFPSAVRLSRCLWIRPL